MCLNCEGYSDKKPNMGIPARILEILIPPMPKYKKVNPGKDQEEEQCSDGSVT